MALPRETIGKGASPFGEDCRDFVTWGVCKSAAGWYIGTSCKCGPYSRESVEYYPTIDRAEVALRNDTWTRR